MDPAAKVQLKPRPLKRALRPAFEHAEFGLYSCFTAAESRVQERTGDRGRSAAALEPHGLRGHCPVRLHRYPRGKRLDRAGRRLGHRHGLPPDRGLEQGEVKQIAEVEAQRCDIVFPVIDGFFKRDKHPWLAELQGAMDQELQANKVLPQSARPQVKIERPRGRPPSVMSSRPPRTARPARCTARQETRQADSICNAQTGNCSKQQC